MKKIDHLCSNIPCLLTVPQNKMISTALLKNYKLWRWEKHMSTALFSNTNTMRLARTDQKTRACVRLFVSKVSGQQQTSQRSVVEMTTRNLLPTYT